jgi:alpha-D-xyloside xylohydrolase
LQIYTGANGEFVLYDDDGKSLGYRDGSDAETLWIRFRWDDSSRKLTIEPDKRMKKWPGGVRKYSVKLANWQSEPTEVEFRGKRVTVKL